MKQHKIVLFPHHKLEAAEDHNCESIAEGMSEHKDLHAIRSTLISIDAKNGIIGDELVINHGIKLVNSSIEKNEKQVRHSRCTQEVFDEVQRIKKVVAFRQNNMPPLEAA